MTVPQPEISIVIPVRDRVGLLRRALESILKQEDCEVEIIVVDDGSSVPVAERVQVRDGRVRYVRQAPSGANPARNRGASLARGRYLTFLDSDDEALPGWLGAILDELRSGAGIVCCGFERVEADGTSREFLPSPMALLGVAGMFAHAGTFAMPTAHFRAIGGYADDLPAGQHTELSLRLVPRAIEEGWRIVNIDRALIRYYADMSDGIRRNDAAVLGGVEYLLREHYDLLAAHPRRLAKSYPTGGVRAFRLGRRAKGRRFFAEAVRTHPAPIHWARLAVSLVPGLGSRFWRRGPTNGARSDDDRPRQRGSLAEADDLARRASG